MKNTLLLATTILLAFAGVAPAQILYEDSFSGTGVLNGTAPTTDHLNTAGTSGAGALWIASAQSSITGSSASISDNNLGASAYLPFVPVAGDNYTLSTTLMQSRTDSQWAAFGFTTAGTATAGTLIYNEGSSPWMLLQGDNTISAFSGPSTSGQAPGTFTGVQGGTYTLTLDTFSNPLTPWTYSVSGPGISTGPLTFASNPTINYVAMGVSAYGTATFTDFTLTDISAAPEPSTYTFLGLGGLALLMIRRLRASRKV